ncbi:CLUMA_CG013419, isoform A [Clunio marinus]|uniref:CLUMA_CG013419, isoform A n=1 Tax=Clunio marinus TaxID=568069 RepID=A0A1J1IM41_9DIPT|nr:CLUMA_CG013419, isoform A [Clunio marinus]
MDLMISLVIVAMEISQPLKLFIFLGFFILLGFSYAKRIKTVSSIVCSGSNKTWVLSECYVKPVSKHQSGFNIVLDMNKKVDKIMVYYDFCVKLGKGFRTIVKGDNVEICRFFNGTNVGLMKYAMSMLENFPAKALAPCPKEGHLEFLNITIGKPGDKKMAPTTNYSLFLRLHNENDDNLGSIKLFIDVLSVRD